MLAAVYNCSPLFVFPKSLFPCDALRTLLLSSLLPITHKEEDIFNNNKKKK